MDKMYVAALENLKHQNDALNTTTYFYDTSDSLKKKSAKETQTKICK